MSRSCTAWISMGALRKSYRGGDTTPIWLANLSDSKIEKVPRDNSNDYNPMWIGAKVYFLSDRNGPVTLWSYDTHSHQVKEEIKNSGLDFKSAGAGPDGIVIEQFGGLSVFDIKSGRVKPVPVNIAGDLPEVRERMVNVSARLTNAHLSPNAARAVFEARGEIITVPAEKGDVRVLTNTPKIMERSPAWSPDGKTIAYFSDETGEYELHLAPQSGMGPVAKIAMPEPGFYRSPLWSPDSKWLAYSTRLTNYLGAIQAYSLVSGKVTQITDGMSDAKNPVFDKDGKYLYFTASTDSGHSLQPDVGSFMRQMTSNVYLVVLAKDQPSPFAPESDEEKPGDASKTEPPKPDAAKPDGGGPDAATPDAAAAKPGAAKPPAKTPDVKIDFENIGQRILAMP